MKLKEKVYSYLTKIPLHKVVTYSQVAEYLGNKKLCRVVGNILHNNEDSDKYPCFRVVNAKGKLAINFGYGGLEGQRKRLEEDGIVVKDNAVDLKKYQWVENA